MTKSEMEIYEILVSHRERFEKLEKEIEELKNQSFVDVFKRLDTFVKTR